MKRRAIYLAVVPLVFIAGCANETLFFATKSSIGIDITATNGTPSANLGYGRTEIAIVPPKQDGNAHDVIGGIDADLSLGNGVRIKELFATGKAAKLAAGKSNDAPAERDKIPAPPAGEKPAPPDQTKLGQPIVFAADASFSLLNIQIQSNGLPASGSTLYRRSEVTLIPVKSDQKEVASVYADISIDTTSGSLKSDMVQSRVGAAVGDYPSNFQSNGVRIVQNFATGEAAEKLAQHDEIKGKLQMVAKGIEYDDAAAIAATSTLRDKLNSTQDSKKIKAFFKWLQQTYPNSEADKYNSEIDGKAGTYFTKKIEPMLIGISHAAKLDISKKADEMLK